MPKKQKPTIPPAPIETIDDLLPTADSPADELDLSAMDEEIRKEQQYGDRPGTAFLGSALSAATFNASDAIAVASGLTTPEAIEETRARSPVAATAGTAAGIVAPAVASLGASIPARVAATPLTALNAISKPAASAVAKQFSSAAGKKIAHDLTKNAVEGALIGAGQLSADLTMGNRDLSAESLMGTVGLGALWGGGIGGAIGTSRVIAPPMLRATRKITTPAADLFSEYVSPYSGKVDGYLKALTSTPQQAARLGEDLGEKYVGLLPDYAEKYLEFGVTSTPLKLAKTNQAVLKTLGKELKDTVAILDNAKVTPLQTTPSSIFVKLDDTFQRELDKLRLLPNFTKADATVIKNLRKDIIKNLGIEFSEGAYIQTKPLSFSALNKTRELLASKSYSPATARPLEKYTAKIARELYGTLRDSLDNVAAEIEPTLGAKLKQLNSDIHIGLTAQRRLTQAARTGAKISPRGAVAGAVAATTGFVSPELAIGLIVGQGPAARLVRNAMLVSDLQGKVKNVVDKVSSGVGAAFIRTGAAPIAATQAILKAALAADEQNKPPKTKKQAVINIQKNITSLVENPEKMVEVLARRTSRISELNPELGAVLQERMINGLQFLQSKVPKPAINPGVFQRKYEPSDLELSKFERYFNVVEQPLIVLEELKKGTLTREHVEALQFVYPEIYKQIRLQTLDLIANNEKQFSYERKLQLGILLNIPADSSLQPQSVLMLQQNLNPAPEQQAAGPDFRPAGLEQTGISDRAQVGSEKIANRE